MPGFWSHATVIPTSRKSGFKVAATDHVPAIVNPGLTRRRAQNGWEINRMRQIQNVNSILQGDFLSRATFSLSALAYYHRTCNAWCYWSWKSRGRGTWISWIFCEEYSVSDRPCDKAKIYSIEELSARATISETCLTHLLHSDTLDAFKIEDTTLEPEPVPMICIYTYCLFCFDQFNHPRKAREHMEKLHLGYCKLDDSIPCPHLVSGGRSGPRWSHALQY
jgi:hypothetical protein